MSVGRSDNIVSDLKEALARLNQEEDDGKKLPPNLVLSSAVLDEEKLQNHRQQLLEQNWKEELNFIQAPIIDLIAHDKLLSIVTRQGGQAVAQASGLLINQDPSLETPEEQSEGLDSKEQEPLSSSAAEDPEISSFGVPVKRNLADSDNLTAVSEKRDDPSTDSNNQRQNKTTPVTSEINKSDKSLFSSSKTRGIKQSNKLNIKLIAIIAMIAGLITTVAIGFFYLKQNYMAQIVVIPSLKDINQDVIITLDPNAAKTDAAANILKAEVVAKEVSGSNNRQTTGIKLVGEEATGTINLFNKTNEDKTFAEGIIITSGELVFSLDEEVIVPAATVEENETGDGEVKEYGQLETTATAEEIGADSNISQDTELQVEDFSEDTYSAKAVSDFSGGSSREIRVVSEEDREELLVSLRQSLLKEAHDEFASESNNGVYFNPTDNYQIVSQQFSHEVGDEVEQLSLDLTLSAEAISYTSGDLKLLAQEVLQGQVPEGYQLLDQAPEIMSQPVEEEQAGEQMQLEANLSGQMQAVVDEDQVKKDVSGLLITQAQTNLKANEKINQTTVELKPSISRLIFKKLPNDSTRLVVTTN